MLTSGNMGTKSLSQSAQQRERYLKCTFFFKKKDVTQINAHVLINLFLHLMLLFFFVLVIPNHPQQFATKGLCSKRRVLSIV
jgi:hypothetical protein